MRVCGRDGAGAHGRCSAGYCRCFVDGDVLAADRSGVVPVAVVVRLRSAEVYLVEVDRMDPIALAHSCWEIGNMHAPLFRGDSDEHTVRMYTPVQPVLGRMLRGVEGVRLSLVTRELDADRRFASSAAEVVVSMAPDFTIVKKARGSARVCARRALRGDRSRSVLLLI